MPLLHLPGRSLQLLNRPGNAAGNINAEKDAYKYAGCPQHGQHHNEFHLFRAQADNQLIRLPVRSINEFIQLCLCLMDGFHIVCLHIGSCFLLLILQCKLQDVFALRRKFIQRRPETFNNRLISQKILLYDGNLLLNFSCVYLRILQRPLSNHRVSVGNGAEYGFLHRLKTGIHRIRGIQDLKRAIIKGLHSCPYAYQVSYAHSNNDDQ